METKLNCKSFGIVIYMDASYYDTEISKNDVIHIPISKEDVMVGLFKKFYEMKLGDKIVDNFVIGHEHGKENHKCHMQIFIKFESKIQKQLDTGVFEYLGVKFLFIVQRCKSPKKLREYCKKGGDFLESFLDKKIKDVLRDHSVISETFDVDDPYDILLTRTDLSEENIKTIFSTCNVTEYKKNFINNSKQIFDTYNKYIKIEEKVPDFKWKFPQHMLDYIHDLMNVKTTKFEVYTCIYNWYKKYCDVKQEDVIRRKALFLFSIKGGMGKSYFARGLVPEISVGISPYYVYCRGTLDGGEFAKKQKTARLVILDDINYISNDIEIWKALSVSEPTNIRSPYHNIPWLKSLPCIMLSNNVKTFKYWLETEDLKSRCIFIGIDFYIGPPGTIDKELYKTNCVITDDIKNRINY